MLFYISCPCFTETEAVVPSGDEPHVDHPISQSTRAAATSTAATVKEQIRTAADQSAASEPDTAAQQSAGTTRGVMCERSPDSEPVLRGATYIGMPASPASPHAATVERDNQAAGDDDNNDDEGMF